MKKVIIACCCAGCYVAGLVDTLDKMITPALIVSALLIGIAVITEDKP